METTAIEPWIRTLRSLFSRGRSCGPLLVPVQVSAGFPFADLPENGNLPNLPLYTSQATKGVVRTPGRRALQLPEITVHQVGASFPQRYMDNYIMSMYSHDIKLPIEYLGKVAAVKNVVLENKDGTLTILKEGEHYVFDSVRHVITFHVEFFHLVYLGTKVKYAIDLFAATEDGPMEIITEGVVVKGEEIGRVYSMEVDETLQIDFWGGDIKQCEWMLQRFRNLWINERKLRQTLASYGLVNMNLSWSHGGIVKSFNEQLRPYLYNISSIVRFTTEYRMLELAHEFFGDFEKSNIGWLGNVAPSSLAPAIREYSGKLTLDPFRIRFVSPWGSDRNPTKDAGYGLRNTMGFTETKFE